jgi:peptidoglycan/xylan/chitin deacetylase (PgdA/CDA1 family)
VPSGTPLVLAYHAVSERWQHPLAVTEAQLHRHLRLLLSLRFRPAPADEILSRRGRLLHVSFDDAYTSVARVLPRLAQLGVPATVFACAGYADTGAPLAVPELVDEVAAHPSELATMTWDALRELIEQGVEVGSHTISHPHLVELAEGELTRELLDSRTRLEDELRRPCRYLSYPYGEQDARVRDAARAAGYEAAFALPGIDRPPDPFAFPRIGIYQRDNVARAALKTSALRRPALALAAMRGASRRLPAAKDD